MRSWPYASAFETTTTVSIAAPAGGVRFPPIALYPVAFQRSASPTGHACSSPIAIRRRWPCLMHLGARALSRHELDVPRRSSASSCGSAITPVSRREEPDRIGSRDSGSARRRDGRRVSEGEYAVGTESVPAERVRGGARGRGPSCRGITGAGNAWRPGHGSNRAYTRSRSRSSPIEPVADRAEPLETTIARAQAARPHGDEYTRPG